MLVSRSSPLRLLLFSSLSVSRSLSSSSHLLSRPRQVELQPEEDREERQQKTETTSSSGSHLVRPHDLRPPLGVSQYKGQLLPYRGIGSSAAHLSFARSKKVLLLGELFLIMVKNVLCFISLYLNL